MRRFLTLPNIVLLVLIMAGVGMVAASATLTMSSADFRRLRKAYENRDIDTLHRLLANSRAVETKQIAVYYLGEIGDERSIPEIARMLCYELPWYDQQWLDMLDGEPYTKPMDVRIAAYQALSDYGDRIIPEMKQLVSGKPGYGQMYAAALLVKLGENRYVEVLSRYTGEKKLEDEMWYLQRDLGIKF